MTVYTHPPLTVVMNKNWRWPKASHLIADTDIELHELAKSIGLKRQWHQTKKVKKFSHYDLTPNKYIQAIEMGAIDLSIREFVIKQREIK